MSETPEERFSKRGGRVIASRIADVLSKGKGEAESKTRAAYRDELVAEILTGSIVVQHPSVNVASDIHKQILRRIRFAIEETV